MEQSAQRSDPERRDSIKEERPKHRPHPDGRRSPREWSSATSRPKRSNRRDRHVDARGLLRGPRPGVALPCGQRSRSPSFDELPRNDDRSSIDELLRHPRSMSFFAMTEGGNGVLAVSCSYFGRDVVLRGEVTSTESRSSVLSDRRFYGRVRNNEYEYALQGVGSWRTGLLRRPLLDGLLAMTRGKTGR